MINPGFWTALAKQKLDVSIKFELLSEPNKNNTWAMREFFSTFHEYCHESLQTLLCASSSGGGFGYPIFPQLF